MLCLSELHLLVLLGCWGCQVLSGLSLCCRSGVVGAVGVLSGVVGAVGVLSGCPLLSGVSGVSVDNLTHLTRAAHGHTVGWCRVVSGGVGCVSADT